MKIFKDESDKVLFGQILNGLLASGHYTLPDHKTGSEDSPLVEYDNRERELEEIDFYLSYTPKALSDAYDLMATINKTIEKSKEVAE